MTHLSAITLAKIDSSIANSEAFLDEMKKAGSEQLPWLKDALKASTARWKIVFLHHAIYSAAYKNGGHGKDSGVLKLRQLLTPIFFENNVDVVFAGHDHVVAKIKPQIAPDNIHKVYYMIEGGSAKLRKGDLDTANSFHEWGEDRKYSFLLADLSQAELKIDVIDSSGKILKSFVLTK
jgi:3',5'-cyclic AMP phosphodiesterase CpdA